MPDPTSEIDPYHKWLGIPKHQQPPTLYRLLGIELFESSAEVIDAAATRQVAYLHQLTSGPHRKMTQGLMNEIAKARRTLIDDVSRENYDARLREKIASQTSDDSAGQSVTSGAAAQAPSIDIGVPAAKPVGNVAFAVDTGQTKSHASIAEASPAVELDPKPEKPKKSDKSDKPEKPLEIDVPERNGGTKPEAFPAFDFGSPSKDSLPPDKLKTPDKPKAPANKKSSKLEQLVSEKKSADAKQKKQKPVADEAATDDDDEEEATETKSTRKGKPWWDRNDWRIHVGISAFSIFLLVIYLMFFAPGSSDRGDSPPQKFDQPMLDNFDSKFN